MGASSKIRVKDLVLRVWGLRFQGQGLPVQDLRFSLGLRMAACV